MHCRTSLFAVFALVITLLTLPQAAVAAEDRLVNLNDPMAATPTSSMPSAR